MRAVQLARKLQLTLDKSTVKPGLMIAAIWHFANHGEFD
jgi:hypothetical protein